MAFNNNLTDSITDTSKGLLLNKPIVTPNTSPNLGMKVNPTNPQYGWNDLLGPIALRGGGTNPNAATFIGNFYAYQFATGDECMIQFHWPHDYAPGTDVFFHVHWAHNSAAVTSGAVTFSYSATFAKGFDQEAWPAQITNTVTQTASTVQYRHMVAETQMSTPGGSATLLDTNKFEVDGLLLVRLLLSGDTINGAVQPFIFTADIHYQSTNMVTKNKAPNFYN